MGVSLRSEQRAAFRRAALQIRLARRGGWGRKSGFACTDRMVKRFISASIRSYSSRVLQQVRLRARSQATYALQGEAASHSRWSYTRSSIAVIAIATAFTASAATTKYKSN